MGIEDYRPFGHEVLVARRGPITWVVLMRYWFNTPEGPHVAIDVVSVHRTLIRARQAASHLRGQIEGWGDGQLPT